MNVDVNKAMDDGRRLRKQRRWAVAATAAATVAVISVVGFVHTRTGGAAHAQQAAAGTAVKVPASCTVATLPLDGVQAMELDGADPTGVWQFGTVNPNNPHHEMVSMIWRDGKVAAKVPVKSEQAIKAINANGVAVGWDGRRPFVVRDGVRTAMQGVEEPVAINSSGVVAGFEDSSWEDKRYPVRWESTSAAPQRLPDINGVHGTRVDLIGEDGLVVGTSAGGDQALLWFADGRTKLLDVPARTGQPLADHDGWLWFQAGRYSLTSGTWQRLASDGLFGVKAMQMDPKAWYRGTTFPLPKPDFWNDELGFAIISVSDDAHYVGGETLSTMADQSVPVTPLRWTCTGGTR